MELPQLLQDNPQPQKEEGEKMKYDPIIWFRNLKPETAFKLTLFCLILEVVMLIVVWYYTQELNRMVLIFRNESANCITFNRLPPPNITNSSLFKLNGTN